jgi:lysophospholipase L1-like esterase
VLVACLGDSITEGSPGWDRLAGGDEESRWPHWAALAHPRLEIRNCGIYGQRTDEIAARLDACARGAHLLVVQGGINDIAQGRSVEQAAAALRRMVRRGKELGLRVLLVDVLPWNKGWPGAEAPIRRLNTLLADVAADESVPLLGFHDALEDPARPGRMRDEWTSDGDHPSVAGYRVLGEIVAAALRLPDASGPSEP